MRAADQWKAIEDGLPDDWSEARLAFGPEGAVSDAARILAPLSPGRAGDELVLHLAREDSGSERLRNVLARLDERRGWGTLRLIETETRAVPGEDARRPATRATLVASWQGLLATLPPDWSDLLCELQLDSSDHLARGALLGAPLNPTRNTDAIALRFRVSGARGYGASPGMVRRCLERMDAEDIAGRVVLVVELSDTHNVATQGPVWRIGQRSV